LEERERASYTRKMEKEKKEKIELQDAETPSLRIHQQGGGGDRVCAKIPRIRKVAAPFLGLKKKKKKKRPTRVSTAKAQPKVIPL